MITVRIIKNWDVPDLLRQTPGSTGIWQGIKFTLDDVPECDYAVVLNHALAPATLSCPRENVWVLLQEPPNEVFGHWHKPPRVYRRVFTQDVRLFGGRYVSSHPAVAWHVNRDYDTLKTCSIPDKPFKLSWITSNKTIFEGHRRRLRFLDKMRGSIEFDLFGNGFHPIADKWDALAPYRYSLAVENFQGPYYWTEKLADCFLSWTMPIYSGCENVGDYFPQESMVRIDLNDCFAVDHIKDTIQSDLWKKSREAIAYARELLLNRYQFFPYISGLIHTRENEHGLVVPSQRKRITLPGTRFPRVPLLARVARKIRSFRKKTSLGTD